MAVQSGATWPNSGSAGLAARSVIDVITKLTSAGWLTTSAMLAPGPLVSGKVGAATM